MQISELEDKKVAIWGYGREGRAALAALRWRLPRQPITVFCSDAEAPQLAAMEDPGLTIETQVDGSKLAAFDIVIKSPGISPYTSPAVDAALQGTKFVGGTALWFAEHGDARTVCVTGTKGKSTVTALIAHLLRSGGHRTALAGNIGLPLLELLDVEPEPEFWAIELSSYQTREALRPSVAVVLNFFPEHLDWHGTEARYFQDKLALVTEAAPRIAVLNAADPRLVGLSVPDSTRVIWFNDGDGWHLRDTDLYRGEQRVLDTRRLPLPGRHNRLNLCAALAAVEALGLDAVALAAHAQQFKPLPHRLQFLGGRDGLDFVNDSISTTPHASLAALDCYKGRRIAILVGGYDRGVDWGVFADRVAVDPPKVIITMGQNGPRIFERLKPIAPMSRFHLAEAAELEDALRLARELLENDGLVLLSPGAPSFPRYKDYVERGRHFAKAAGFDPEQISAIPGLGIS
ncbi:MAG TPA: UDP-N-acetylmuramoyl-L-alanine--D-glutamate ligase [Arenimonas sp.]|uniref:UDP-N-acetylmuramoyl-L-alanine--D-glutamate ligase n=1 Tax=Arenimonas sp. TaxID=1872635 RepID=UPI002C4D04C9|nr:UDP-N-acetylmuramoyl-L-alanine--D-glutamate ligase [Arenimonas sp.]HMB57966.1 UDP-N-acetylmuramoyl-L-alanine--D-glutamate ligase [Arenimonas sp.]